MKDYKNISFQLSRQVTKEYSTSFYSATCLMNKDIRNAIFGIYGFVRFADEIVDTFDEYDKRYLLDKFEKDYYESVELGISLNPILQSFQQTIRKYNIPDEYVSSFLTSMRRDLLKKEYSNKGETDEYIYGSADVVGLMCLKVFCDGNEVIFNELKNPAMKLGSAFQKVNFLRDLKNDLNILGRQYFHKVNKLNFSDDIKSQIIDDIKKDFEEALDGLKKLPGNVKLAVTVAYYYYLALLKKIEKTPAQKIMIERIRISNLLKFFIIVKALIMNKLKLI